VAANTEILFKAVSLESVDMTRSFSEVVRGLESAKGSTT
jgi:hypothetical protein